MKRALKLFNWILCRSIVILFICLVSMSVAFAGGYGPSTNANTVQGKAPAAASGLATLDASSKLVQDANTVGGKAPAVANGLATLNAASKVIQPALSADSLNIVSESSTTLASAMTLTVGIGYTILTTNIGTVTAGDRLMCSGGYIATTGTITGTSDIYFSKQSGTANVKLLKDNNNNHAATFPAFPLLGYVVTEATGIVRVITSGTLTLGLRGLATGSNQSIVAGEAELYCLFLKKQ